MDNDDTIIWEDRPSKLFILRYSDVFLISCGIIALYGVVMGLYIVYSNLGMHFLLLIFIPFLFFSFHLLVYRHLREYLFLSKTDYTINNKNEIIVTRGKKKKTHPVKDNMTIVVGGRSELYIQPNGEADFNWFMQTNLYNNFDKKIVGINTEEVLKILLKQNRIKIINRRFY